MSQTKNSRGKNDSPASAKPGKRFKRIPNPYNPYDIESGMLFYRKDVIEKIKTIFDSEDTRKLIVIQGYRGSGKTSTLSKMADEPAILGERFIPIYLKIGKDEIPDLDNFLLFFHKSIKNALENLGISVNGMLISNISLQGLENVIDRIEFKTGDDRFIVVIFDDFENIRASLLTNKNLADINKFLQYLLAKQNIFRVILAGAGQIFEWAEGTELKNFLRTDAKIDLEYLDEKLFENLIVEPVKGNVRYTPAAIKEIKKITGRNLYCQQLLCFYIVRHLNKIKKNVCAEVEVHQALKNTVNDKREDFAYFWKNMSYERQIVAAALTDDKVVKKKGAYYFLEEATLLNRIFGEDTLQDTFKKLVDIRYINRMEGRRFVGTPYKVPLFGEWVKKNHSFTQTLLDNWETIINRVSLSNLGELIKTIPADILPIDDQTAKDSISLSESWDLLRNSLKRHRLEQNNLEEILENLCQKLAFKIIARPENNKSFFLIDASSLNLSGFAEIRIFFFHSEEPDYNEIHDIQEEIQQYFSQPSFFSFIICVRNTDIIKELVGKEFLGIVLITEANLKKLVLSPRPLQVFKEDVLIRQVKPSRINTYQTHGPATITFYGRHDELGRILGAEKKNFAIVGARKIGKTSLLHQVAKKLPTNTMPIYMDLENPKEQDYHTFFQALLSKTAAIIDPDFDWEKDISNLQKLVEELCRKTGKILVLLLDEIDILIKFDGEYEYQLLRTLRALNQEGFCQCIFSGFEQLYMASLDLQSPLYNFCEFIPLTRFRESDSLALITEPMQKVWVKYDDPEERKLILEYTSCHPNLLQFFCKTLIENIEKHENEKERRTIFGSDIRAVYESFAYEKYVIHDFYLFSTENITHIERLIVLLLLDDYPEQEVFTVIRIDEKLKKHGINLTSAKIFEILGKLRLRYIFIAVGGEKYRFALPVFPELLKKRENLQNYIDKEIEYARKSL